MSKLYVDQVDPKTATTLTRGTSSDTISIPSGVTLDVASGATLDTTGATVTGDLKLTAIVKKAHELNMIVHPYTFRTEKLPSYADSFDNLLHIFFNQAKVDGIFTDFPDHVFEFVEKK